MTGKTLQSCWVDYQEKVVEPSARVLPDVAREVVIFVAQRTFFVGALVALNLLEGGADTAALIAEIEAEAEKIREP
jgi:hypothetical protein